jgi:hypothetical protein
MIFHANDMNMVLMATWRRLYCGFEGAIEVFDLDYPGEGTRLLTTPSKKSRDGLKGEWLAMYL